MFSSLYLYAETRAAYGYKVALDKSTNITVKQAANKKESKAAKAYCKKLANEIKTDKFVVKRDKEKKIYRVYTKKSNTLVGWRGTKEMTQAFISQLKNVRVEPCEEKCPIHVRLILDEFANIGQIPDFDQKLATIRKYDISCSIILQALSQLKDIYKDKWNTIVSNCDTKLFLGCDDTETIEWMLKMLGKKTTTVQQTSYQDKGKGSISYNKSSIDLLTIDQISMMQDSECLVRIRGVRPYYGKKYELTDHPNYDYAHKTKDTFTVPLAKDAAFRQEGPLRLRLQKKNKKIEDAAAVAEGKPTDDKADETNNTTPVSKPKSDEERKKQMKTGNKARKKKADEAREALKHVDEFDSNLAVNTIESLLNASGISKDDIVTGNVTDDKITEAAESFVNLIYPPSDKPEYKRTE